MEPARREEQILVIEDDPQTQANLRNLLERDGYAIETSRSMSEALARSDLPEAAVILVDRRQPAGDVLDFLSLLGRAPRAAIVVVTEQSDLEGIIEALRHGAADYIVKPINPDSLRNRIGRLLEQRRLTLAKERGDSVFRNLVEAAECMIVMLRPADLAIRYFSPFAEQLTGYTARELSGKSFADILTPEPDRPHLIACCREALGGTPRRQIESRILCRDGSTRVMLRNIRCLPDYDGSPVLLTVGHDITELKAAQERALQAERMAAIGQMCAGLAHESRNALQRSQACLEMLAMRLGDRAQALDLIVRIQQAQDDLHRLYEDVREYAAPLKLVFRECNLAEIWRRAWADLEPVRRGRRAILREPSNAPSLACLADAFRLEQVFRNILDNALAACADCPDIRIYCSAARLEGREAIRIAVRDNGPGLGPTRPERIFESFYTTKTHGTGLGLAIVRRIVEDHGGRVVARDAEGRGAEIVITLPRHQGG